MTIDQIEAQMKARALNFVGLGALVKFDLGGGDVLFIDGRATPPTVGRQGAAPDTTLTISGDNLMKLADGKLAPTLAFMTGKLKVSGNMGIALKLANMLED
ncbi:sterol carrier protein [Niveispirillum lacus]|uniref:Sterol carrier protein n=1 Tax=Niveispirillum lacus TaxID=1981099 RepID=A0A255YWJ9_9PROT|nr:SCP2 sterol-binding domain-containing protein [Niveispirillum lacus]OYQ33578.1 sterol carrier protein [Niveispirillum lacus]